MIGCEVALSLKHEPVMVNEVLKGLNIDPQGIYVDATFGRGGHSRAILEQLDEKGRLFALDKDPSAALAAQILEKEERRFQFKHQSFGHLLEFCRDKGILGKVSGLLMDLGVSSPQVDSPERGFSFLQAGPLDMRMDTTKGSTAADWLQTATEESIQQVLKDYGEERFYKRIARAIITAREETAITRTEQLASIVAAANPAWEKHKHPATRTFQAIRIFINNELEEINLALEQSLQVLKPSGRLVVISFHSLEDRLVKQFIQKNETDSFPKQLPLMHSELHCPLRRIGQKQKPSDTEINQNRRARSAVLRVAEKRGEL